MLQQADSRVTPILGQQQLNNLERITDGDLLVLGHLLPRDQKQRAIRAFRHYCKAPVLSLLAPNQNKLPEADFGVEAFQPSDVIQIVKQILES